MNLRKYFFLSITGLFLLIVWGTISDRQLATNFTADIQTLSNFTYKLDSGETGTLTLPYNFENLAPRTAVTLYTEVAPTSARNLLIKTVYTPLRLYADDQLIYESGQTGSYSAFLLDPPTIVKMIALPEVDGVQQLRFEYLSPTQRHTMNIPAISIGNEAGFVRQLVKQNGFSFISSLMLLLLGTAMVLAAFTLMRAIPASVSFLWLGLFALATGIWTFGECNLTQLFIPYPSLLYIMAFTGLFMMTIPLLQFGILVLNLRYKRPLKIMLFIMALSAIGSLALQLAGLVGLSRSMYLFHLLIPIALILFSACIVWESVRYQNMDARRFVLPMIILAASTLLETVNYQFRFTNISLCIQSGVLLFIVALGIIGGQFTREAFRVKADKIRLEFEVALMAKQLDSQKQQYCMLMENAEAVKAQRHDLRHQFAVLKHYNDADAKQALGDYIDELLAKIPVDSELNLCENFAVNAIAGYYVTLAKINGIDVRINLMIPPSNGQVQDSDLCIIVGNLLENAIEACKYLPEGTRFIKLNSRIQYGIVTIVMDNSFDGHYEQLDDVFLSRKRSGKGTGLTSVQAVAKKYGGSARFTAKENVFMSSVYVVTHAKQFAKKL